MLNNFPGMLHRRFPGLFYTMSLSRGEGLRPKQAPEISSVGNQDDALWGYTLAGQLNTCMGVREPGGAVRPHLSSRCL